MLPRPSLPTPSRRCRPPPPLAPTMHPTFLSRTAPATDLAVMVVAQHSVLFFVGDVHQIEITKGDNVNAELEIQFDISGIAPPVRPTTLWHLLNTAQVCPLCICVCLLDVLTNCSNFVRNAYEFRTHFVRTNVLGKCANTEVSAKFV